MELSVPIENLKYRRKRPLLAPLTLSSEITQVFCFAYPPDCQTDSAQNTELL